MQHARILVGSFVALIFAMFSLPPLPPPARLPVLLMAALCLMAGVLGGLSRLGFIFPEPMARQAAVHGALMIAAFFGTLISLERAVALARAWPYLAPICAAVGGALILSAAPMWWGQCALIVAASVFLLGSLQVCRQQVAVYTVTLALGAATWLLGNLLWLATGSIPTATPLWMAFLLLTIAGERLELTRFLPSPRGAQEIFILLVLMLLLASLIVALWQQWIYLAVVWLFLAIWLLRYDIARRTVKQAGLTRFIAVCLLFGYFWLAVAGGVGIVAVLFPEIVWRDALLHSVLLGFVFSMVFGHAAIIFPAVLRVKLPYHPCFYLPLALLQGSLLVRVGAGLLNLPQGHSWAAIGNAFSLLVFILTMLASVVRGRRKA